MTLTANWSYPTAMRFGAGRVAELPDACAAAGIRRPLLVSDRGLAPLPITEAALDILEQGGLGRAVFAEVDPNPTEINLDAGVAAYRAGGHDGVVAFGGGSALDLGKMVAFMAGQTRPVWDFEDVGDWWTRADADAIAPAVAVPTTAGTGSEVGRASVHHQRGDAGEEDHLPPQGAACGGDLRPRAHRGHAEADHGGHRHGRLGPLPGGLLLELLPPDGPGHRAGGDAPRP